MKKGSLMQTTAEILESIFMDDPEGFLNTKPKVAPATDDDRIIREMQEINVFFEKNGREPSEDAKDVQEYKLARTLAAIKKNSVCEKPAFYDVDIHGLVVNRKNSAKKNVVKPKINSIEDILNSPEFAELNDDSPNLFKMRSAIKKAVNRESPDFVARRKACKNFEKYEPLFRRVQDDLKQGLRRLLPFRYESLKAGNYYVANGVLLYVESIIISNQRSRRQDGSNVFKNGRTHCVFENGTESNMLMRSLADLLYQNGRIVTEKNVDVAKLVEKELSSIKKRDKKTGCIYVCKSLSKDPKIKKIKDLYKIGFCTTTVEERLQNAENEPTYLMAPVKQMGVWQCFNMNAQKFEDWIHIFFGKCCLNIDVFDAKGRRHRPQEWFVVPLHVIENAIEIIVSGKIANYYYDIEKQTIEKRKVKEIVKKGVKK